MAGGQSMLKTLLLVGCGGFIGSALRYLVSHAIEANALSSFPYGTFTVNVIGSLIIGIIYGLTVKNLVSPEIRLLAATGFCGGLTTFSTFSYELLTLMQDNQFFHSFIYAAGSLVAGFLAAWIGFSLIKLL